MQKIRVLALSGSYNSASGGSPESLRLLARSLDQTVVIDVLSGNELYLDVGRSTSLPERPVLHPPSVPKGNGSSSLSSHPYSLIMAFGAWISPKIWWTALTRHNGLRLPIIYLPRGSLSQIEFTGITRRVKKTVYFFLLEYWLTRISNLFIFSSTIERDSARILGGRRFRKGLISSDPSDHSDVIKDFTTHLNESKRAKVVGLLAEIHPRKGIEEAIEGFRILEGKYPGKYRLLVGGGPHKSAVDYTDRIKIDLPINVEFFGRVSPQDKNFFYSSIDALIVPSKFESYSLVCAEAVARRVPLICSRQIGFLEGLDARELNIGILDSVTPEQIASAVYSFDFRFEDDLQKRVRTRSLEAATSMEKAIKNLVTR